MKEKMKQKMKQKRRSNLLYLLVVMMLMLILPVRVNATEPEKPAELTNRQNKNHEYTYVNNPKGEGGGYEYGMNGNNTMIMPGDTFEFKVHKSGEGDSDFYYSLGYWDSDKKAYEVGYDGEADEYTFPEGYTASTAVSVISEEMITKKGDNAESYYVPVKFKNNSAYPIVLGLNMSGSAGQHGQSYLTRGLTVRYLKPYYALSYSFYGESETMGMKDLFYALGEYDSLDFPQYYWITDVPYKITIPNPVMEGYHFKKWTSLCGNNYEDRGSYTEVTIYWNPEAENTDTSNHIGREGDKKLEAQFENGATIRFCGNGGLVNGRDSWLLEVGRDDTVVDNPVYNFSLDLTTGDVKAAKKDDTFLGWCKKEDALYNFTYNEKLSSGSFVTKDSAADAYEALKLGTSGIDNNWNKGVLYAKWSSNTRETLETKGWDVDDDGVLWLLNSDGASAWKTAKESDPTLAGKITDINTGFVNDESMYINDTGVFEDCVGLTELSFSDVAICGAESFKNCSKLKKITIVKNDTWNWYNFFGSKQFEGTDLDLVINVPEDKLASCREYYPEYAYLFNADTNARRYPITVNGSIITDKKLSVKCGDGTATFDPETSTLTIENAEFSSCMNLHNVKSVFWNGEYNQPYNEAAIVSNLPELKIILKGKNVVKREKDYQLRDFVRAYGNVEITGDGSIEACLTSSTYFIDNEPYIGVCKLPITGLKDVTIDGVTAKRLIVDPEGKLTLKNTNFDGGQFSSKGNVSIENVEITSDSSTGGPDNIMDTIVGADKVLTIEGSILDNVTIKANETAEAITISNSNLTLKGRLLAGSSTKLDIVNSSINAYGKSEGGVTNIAEANITLNGCAITKGAWTESGYFIIAPQTPSYYTVSFNTDGGSAITALQVAYGDSVAIPKKPVKDGYTFDGWYGDSKLTKPFDFTTKIKADTTIYAKWKQVEDKDTGKDPVTGGGTTGGGTTGGGTTGGGTTDGGTTGGGTTGGGTTGKTPAVGTIEKDNAGKATYKVAETTKDDKGNTIVEVSYVAPADNQQKATAITIPDTVTLSDGTKANVTSVSAAAFKNNPKLKKVTIGKYVRKIEKSTFSGKKKLKTIIIKSSNLTSIGKNAFKNINSKATIRVPKKKLKAYKKLLKKAGLSKKVNVKKL